MVSPTLDTLPSELRKLIVSFLVPSGSELERYARNGKIHLKMANMAARCLHDWVPEFMFQDMSLLHVSVDSASHLERFAITTDNEPYLKYVKTIQVKVPPAIRWDLNTEDPFDTIEDITQQRLAKGKYKLKRPSELSDSQKKYCAKYHRAMIQPFTENRRWHKLKSLAQDSWPDVFACFPNLEQISVGCCRRWEHPAPSYTNAFVTQFGRWVEREADPYFVEDAVVNQAWASSIILDSAPAIVKSLRLSMANLDNLNTYATVNRLLNKIGSLWDGHVRAIKSLTLDMGGWKGTHGTRSWHGHTGSARMVKYWKKMLMSMHSLTHLDIRFDSSNEGERWSDGGESDQKGCILDWLLSSQGIAFEHVTHLCFSGFLVNRDTLCTPKIFVSQDQWPSLKHLILDELRLMWNQEPEGEDIDPAHLDHLQGHSWLRVCQHITATLPGIEIEVYRPISNVNDNNDFTIHQKYNDQMSGMPNVKVEAQGPYRSGVLPPITEYRVHTTECGNTTPGNELTPTPTDVTAGEG